MKKIILILILLIASSLEAVRSMASDGLNSNEKHEEHKLVTTQYLLRLKRKITHNWYPPKDFTKTVQVIFYIDRDGNISRMSILHSSGYNPADECALKAVTAATPFDPLPAELKAPYEVVFNFNSDLIMKNGTEVFNRFYR